MTRAQLLVINSGENTFQWQITLINAVLFTAHAQVLVVYSGDKTFQWQSKDQLMPFKQHKKEKIGMHAWLWVWVWVWARVHAHVYSC